MRDTLLVAAIFFLVGASVRATVMMPLEIDDLARDAVIIARGRVMATDARWAGGHRRIETVVTLSSEAFLKGGAGETVRFVVPGGQLGRYRSITVGAPEFRIGQHVIVFLAGRAPALSHVLGLSAGAFRLLPGPDGWLVTPPLSPETDGLLSIPRGDPRRRLVPLGEFESRVRALTGGTR